MRSMNKLLLILLVGSITLIAQAQGSDFPGKPVRLLVPFAAGGSADFLARSIAKELSLRWKQPVITENRVGASGVVAMQTMLAGPHDGSVITLVSASYAYLPLINHALPYSDRDFVPVVEIASAPNVLIVPSNSPYKTMGDLLADARQHPGVLSYGMAGNGTTPHLAGEMLKYLGKIKIEAVAYKGNAPVMVDVMAGQLPMGFVALADAWPLVKSGKLRILAVAGKSRSPLMPDVPTIAESGIAGYDSTVWWGIVAPSGVPGASLAQLNSDINSAIQSLQVRKEVADNGGEVEGGSAERFQHRVESDRRQLAPIIEAAGIKNE